WRTPMSARSKDHELVGIADIRTAVNVLLLQFSHIDQDLFRSWTSCQWRNLRTAGCASRPWHFYGIGHGSAPQISAAYWAMVRSLENLPLLATFRIAFFAHSLGAAYSA